MQERILKEMISQEGRASQIAVEKAAQENKMAYHLRAEGIKSRKFEREGGERIARIRAKL